MLRHGSVFALCCLPVVARCQGPVISPGGVVNAADYTATKNAVFPIGRGLWGGSIISIFGANLAASPHSASTIPLPFELGGTSVTVSGIAAPLFYVSPGQINFQMPSPWLHSEIPPGPKDIVVVTPNGKSDVYSIDQVGAVGVFTTDASGCGQGTVLNVGADGSLSVNSPSNSASPGDFISIYGTGLGQVYNSPPDGSPAPSNPPAASAGLVPGLFLDFVVAGPFATGPFTSDLYWAGRAPGLVGVDQFNFRVPEGVREGCAVPLQVTNYYGISQPVTIAIRSGGGTCVEPPGAGYGQITWEKTVTAYPATRSPSIETDTVTVSLQASPGKQAPAPAVFAGGIFHYDEFGPSCPLPGYRSLDTGTVAIQGPGFDITEAPVAPLDQGQVSDLEVYRDALPAGTIHPGPFNVTSSGGPDVGAFQSSVQIGQEIHITTPIAPGVMPTYGKDLNISWTGGDPSSWVTVRLFCHQGFQDISSYFRAHASEGNISVGWSTTFLLGTPCVDEVVVEVAPDPTQMVTFSAPGLTLGGKHTWKYTYKFEGGFFR